MLVIYPPEYLPRAAFFAQMGQADICVLADTLQYSRQSYQNRTRIRNPQGWQWLSVPLKARQHGLPIDAVCIDNRRHWARQHLKALQYNYSSAPFFDYYYEPMACVLRRSHTTLGPLLCDLIRCIHSFLQIQTPLLLASELEGVPRSVDAIQAVIGDADLLSDVAVAHRDMRYAAELSVFSYKPSVYRQNFDGFEAGMSVLDLLFNYGPEAMRVLNEGITIAPYLSTVNPA